MLSLFSRVRLYATPWTAAHQAPLSTGFSRQEHWSGLPFPFPKYYMTISILNFSKMQIQQYNFLYYKAFLYFPLLFLCSYYLYIYLFMFIFVCGGSLLLHMGFLQLWQAGATLQLQYTDFSLCCLFLLQSMSSGYLGFSSCSPQAQLLHGM